MNKEDNTIKRCFKCGAIDTKLKHSEIFNSSICEDQGRCSSERKGVRQWNWVGGGIDKALSKSDCFKNIAEACK
jgi:hypothetical protein